MKIVHKYTPIDDYYGDLEGAVRALYKYKDRGMFVSIDFNGHTLYSDIVSMDNAFLQVTGKTKAEYDEVERQWRENYKREEEEHKTRIPELTKEWIQKGQKILSEDRWELWERCVPIRLNDLYKGFELGACLDIIKILNEDRPFEEALEVMRDQGHSGMSFGLICSMLQNFCDRGEEFVRYVRKQ